jgi:hypothetical protein
LPTGRQAPNAPPAATTDGLGDAAAPHVILSQLVFLCLSLLHICVPPTTTLPCIPLSKETKILRLSDDPILILRPAIQSAFRPEPASTPAPELAHCLSWRLSRPPVPVGSYIRKSRASTVRPLAWADRQQQHAPPTNHHGECKPFKCHPQLTGICHQEVGDYR